MWYKGRGQVNSVAALAMEYFLERSQLVGEGRAERGGAAGSDQAVIQRLILRPAGSSDFARDLIGKP